MAAAEEISPSENARLGFAKVLCNTADLVVKNPGTSAKDIVVRVISAASAYGFCANVDMVEMLADHCTAVGFVARLDCKNLLDAISAMRRP